MITQSTPLRSVSLCQRTSAWAPITFLVTCNASWSQLEPGRTTTPNFMTESLCALSSVRFRKLHSRRFDVLLEVRQRAPVRFAVLQTLPYAGCAKRSVGCPAGTGFARAAGIDHAAGRPSFPHCRRDAAVHGRDFRLVARQRPDPVSIRAALPRLVRPQPLRRHRALEAGGVRPQPANRLLVPRTARLSDGNPDLRAGAGVSQQAGREGSLLGQDATGAHR